MKRDRMDRVPMARQRSEAGASLYQNIVLCRFRTPRTNALSQCREAHARDRIHFAVVVRFFVRRNTYTFPLESLVASASPRLLKTAQVALFSLPFQLPVPGGKIAQDLESGGLMRRDHTQEGGKSHN